jgi:hypothetical protein
VPLARPEGVVAIDLRGYGRTTLNLINHHVDNYVREARIACAVPNLIRGVTTWFSGWARWLVDTR